MARKRRRKKALHDPAADALADLADASGRPSRPSKLSVLRRDGTYRPERPKRFNFQHIVIEDYADKPANKWYRMNHWNPGTLVYNGMWSSDWKRFAEDVRIAGLTHEGRERIILELASRPDFRVSLTKHRENPHDPNAVAVWAIAQINGEKRVEHIGYLERDIARRLKAETELAAVPHRITLPHDDINLGITIDVLVRSKAYRKREPSADI